MCDERQYFSKKRSQGIVCVPWCAYGNSMGNGYEPYHHSTYIYWTLTEYQTLYDMINNNDKRYI